MSDAAVHTMSKPDRRKRFVVERASGLAAQAADVRGPWSTAQPLSRFFGWFDGPDALVVVGCPGESQRDLDLGLAYGLAHAGDRELHVVLPVDMHEPTRRRLPWIDAAVRLHTYSGDLVNDCAPLTRSEVLNSFTDPLAAGEHHLGDRTTWVETIKVWADSCAELVAAHRPSYLAWHCRGRMVLRVRRSAGGLAVSAGVHTAAQGAGPRTVEIAESITAEQFHRIVAAASTAIADRLAGVDVANAEHELQEWLAQHRVQVGLRTTVREFPAMRPVGNRGYIDLLGLAKDRIHVVETKIGPDPMLVLQGLDYWVWTTAHLPMLVPYLNDVYQAELSASPEVVLDYVVGEKDAVLVSPYTAAQLEALDGSVPWRMHRIENWDTPDGAVHSLARRVAPVAARVAAPTYPVRLQKHLVSDSTVPPRSGPFFTVPGAGILPEGKSVYIDLKSGNGLHRYVDHVRSSQAFAINLFGGLSKAELAAIWALLDVAAVDVDTPTFEYVDPLDALGERQSSRPHQTQVDVLLRARAADGARQIALVEVKLSETGFGSCSAFDAASNDRRDVCRQSGAWGADRAGCFQLRNHDGPHRRRYDEHLDAAMIPATTGGCPFRELNQPMRNIALARALLDRDEADSAIFAVCAPMANTSIWRQWRLAETTFAAVPGVRLAALPAEKALTALAPDRRDILLERYDLSRRES